MTTATPSAALATIQLAFTLTLPFALARPDISLQGLCRPLSGLQAAAFRPRGIARSTAIHTEFTRDPCGRRGSGGHSLHAWQQSRRPRRWRGQRPGPCGTSPRRAWPPPRSRSCASWCSALCRIFPGPRQPGPPRDLYRRGLPRKCRQVTREDRGLRRLAATTARRRLAIIARCRPQARPEREPPYLHPSVTARVRCGVDAVAVVVVRACLSLLPVPDSCRVLRAGGRVKGRAAPARQSREVKRPVVVSRVIALAARGGMGTGPLPAQRA